MAIRTRQQKSAMQIILRALAEEYWQNMKQKGLVNKPEDMSITAQIQDATGTKHTTIFINMRPFNEEVDGKLQIPDDTLELARKGKKHG